MELNTLLGRDPSAPLRLNGTLRNAAPRGTTGNYVTLAMTRNPSLRTQEMQAQLAGLNLRKTRLGRHPDFAVGPRVEYTDREQTYGFGATVALHYGTSRKAKFKLRELRSRRKSQRRKSCARKSPER